MPARPFRDAPGQTAAVYWRRRGVALLASLAVLGGLSWAAAVGVGTLLRADRAARPDQPSAVSARYGSAARLSSPTHLGVPDATGASRAASVSRSGAHASVPLRSCPAGDVMLSLSASALSYPVRQLPEFDVDVVSTAGYSCSVDIGSQHVVLQIAAGSAEIWTSAECAEGQAAQLATLHRGTSAIVPMTWDDQYSAAGCPIPGLAAPAGVYTATATVGSAASNRVTFRIG